jgi:hypothetical protein
VYLSLMQDNDLEDEIPWENDLSKHINKNNIEL